MRKITKIEQTSTGKTKSKKLRVAAYCRVSTDTDEQETSYETQVSHYTEYINNHPDWQLAGIFADDGISGTNTKKREQFNRMIDECMAGNIDMVITKSISRFSRNTLDCLKFIRQLKEKNIAVWFEKENINSLSGDGEVMLTLLASFAQSETESISNNVKWGIRKRMQAGLPYANGHMNVYGYRWEGDEMVIVPEEAAIVRRIYQNFLDGKSRQETEKEFAAEGIKTRAGAPWVDSNLKVILTNVTYTGNMLYQKEYIADPITKKVKKNRGELPQYYVENTHPAIISKETFDYVQAEMARRRELGCFGNKALTLNCFSTKIKCGQCGRSFVRSTRRNRAKMSRLGEKYTFWACTSHKKTNCPSCSSGTIRENVLKEECAKVLGIPDFDEDIFSERVERITVLETGTMIFEFTDGTTLEHHWYRNAKKESWTDENRQRASQYRRRHPVTRDDITCFTTKIRCEECGCNYRKQTCVMADGHQNAYWKCADKKNHPGKSLREDHLKEIINEVLGLDEFDEQVFLKRIDYISIRDLTHLTFHFTDGSTAERDYEFRKENIWTFDGKGELLITIMSSLAQEESRSISENTTWGRRKAFADGNYSLPWKNFYGYDKGEDGKPVINEEQAEVIRLIYKMFLEGYSAQAIVNELYTRGIKSPMGRDKWNGYNIMYILQNEKMCGDALLQKKYTESFLTKKQIKNNGEIPQYLVEDDHEGIIDKRTWELVQAEIQRRKTKGKKYSGTSIFSSKIICGECGNYYGSKVWHSTDKYRRIIWRCNHKYDGRTCRTPHLTEDEIQELFIKALGELLSDKDEVIENLTLLREAVSDTSELEKKLTDAETEMNLLAEMVQEAVSENAHKAQDQKAYAEKYNGLVSRYDEQKKLHDELSNQITAIRGNDKQMEEFIRQFQELDGAVTEFDENLWSSLVDHITVMKDKRVTFTFKGGTEITV